MATRKRKVTATEETETVTVTRRRRRVAVEDTIIPGTEPLRLAPGWDAMPALTPPELRRQRRGQVEQSLRRIWAAAHGDPAGDRETVRCAAAILRAGPGASPLELLYGRVL